MSVDWGTAERIASLAAGDVPAGAPPHPELQEVAARAARRITDHTGMVPKAPLPPIEVVDRASWARANVATMRATLDPALRTVKVPPAGGLLIALEAGALIGFMSRAVLGQYELALLEPIASPRLLLVGPNLRETAERFEAPLPDLAAWVTYHEVCHAVQFTAVPWLRDHLGGLLRELLSSMNLKVDAGAVLKLRNLGEVKGMWEELQRGGLIGAVAGPERRALLDKVQGTMSLVEGHAEHVMDAAAAPELPRLSQLREALERRRTERPPVVKLLFKLIGLDLKLRQYEEGKRFVDTVVERGGHAALNRAWTSPERLPSPEEIQDPGAWMRRTAVPELPAA